MCVTPIIPIPSTWRQYSALTPSGQSIWWKTGRRASSMEQIVEQNYILENRICWYTKLPLILSHYLLLTGWRFSILELKFRRSSFNDSYCQYYVNECLQHGESISIE
jgi:hypothetical protein